MRKLKHFKSFTFILVTVPCLFCSCLSIISCADNKPTLTLSGGKLTSGGHVNYDGIIDKSFIANETNTKNPQFVWSIIPIDGDDVSNFSIKNGVVRWTKFTNPADIHFYVQVNDSDTKLTAKSGPIHVDIMSTPPTPPTTGINLKSDPSSWKDSAAYTTMFSVTQELSFFTYTQDDVDKTITITGFASKPTGDNVLYPADSYPISGETYKVTTISGVATTDNQKHFFNVNPMGNFYTVLNTSLTTIAPSVFNDCFQDFYVDMTNCGSFTETPSTYDTDSDTGYQFSGIRIKAWIPPTHNEALSYMPDDMFEYSNVFCDIDMRSFTKISTLGHWSCAQIHFGNTTPDGSGTSCFGTLALPSMIDELTWAAFTGSEFNFLYWNTTDCSAIKKVQGDHKDPLVWFPIFAQCRIHDLVLNTDFNTSDQTRVDAWKNFVAVDKKCGFPFDYIWIGPYKGTAQLDTISISVQ